LRERRFDRVQEVDVQRVAFVYVWDVGCEAIGCVLVCEQAYVRELPSEDCGGQLVFSIGYFMVELG